MIQLSPTILNSFQALHDEARPWMTEEKFRKQLLSPFEPSDAADAGNVVHEASFDHALTLKGIPVATSRFSLDVEGRATYTNSDGNTWMVSIDLIDAIRSHCTDWGRGIPEVPFLLTEDEIGIKGVQLSGRADYLGRGRCYELKTSARVKAEGYIQSAQRLIYIIRYRVPLTMILAQVKITHPRGRPEGIKGLVALDRCVSYPIDPEDDDLPKLQSLIANCITFLRTDQAMINHVQTKRPPVLL